MLQLVMHGRWVASTGIGLGLLTLVQRLVTGDSLYGSMWRACVIAGAVMAVVAVAQNFWRGREVDEATLPGGLSLIFGRRTSRALRLLQERIDAQILELSDRVTKVEEDLEAQPTTREDEPNK